MNIQILGRVVSLALCAVVVTISLCVPAKAAPAAFDPDDYKIDTIIDGTTKRVTFKFTNIPVLVDVWEKPSNTKTQYYSTSGSVGYRPKVAGTTSFRFRSFLLGVEQWDDKPALDDSCIDIGDILPGAPIDIGMSFGLDVQRIFMGSNTNPNVGTTTLTVYFNFGFYMFDKDGNFIATKWGHGTESQYEYGSTASNFWNPSYSYTFPANVKYVCPFLDLNISDSYKVDDWLVIINPDDFTFTTSIDMIVEDSLMMDRIEEELDDIENAIQDGNDKLDDIISGGDAADAIKPDNDKISGSTDKMDDAMDDMDDAMDKLPTAPTDLGSLVDDKVLDKALSNGAVLFNWDASGLNNMFPPLGLSCGLSVLFYTIFGKKG